MRERPRVPGLRALCISSSSLMVFLSAGPDEVEPVGKESHAMSMAAARRSPLTACEGRAPQQLSRSSLGRAERCEVEQKSETELLLDAFALLVELVRMLGIQLCLFRRSIMCSNLDYSSSTLALLEQHNLSPSNVWFLEDSEVGALDGVHSRTAPSLD